MRLQPRVSPVASVVTTEIFFPVGSVVATGFFSVASVVATGSFLVASAIATECFVSYKCSCN